MISEQEIRSLAGTAGVTPRVIEKDYYLGILLHAISMDRRGKFFIFKGGTGLRKCYFSNYRFSEDIDFTVTDRTLNSKEKLAGLIREWCNRSNRRFGAVLEFFSISVEREIYGQESYKATVHYNGIDGKGKINLDFTFYEKLELKPAFRIIRHFYSDKTDFGKASLRVYRLEETIAEKLRAISYIHYYPRNRDIYDVWFLCKTKDISADRIADLYVKKCAFKGIDPLLLLKVNITYLARFNKSWQVQLGHQIKHLPSFNEVSREFIRFLRPIKSSLKK